jgi:hypothetical protein
MIVLYYILTVNSKSSNVFCLRFTHIFNKYTLSSLKLANAASRKVYSEYAPFPSQKN